MKTKSLIVLLATCLAMALSPFAVHAAISSGDDPPAVGGGPTEEPPDDPTLPPRRPGTPVLTDRTTSAITFRWLDRSSYEVGNELQRWLSPSRSGIMWLRVSAWGSLNGQNSYTDTGLGPDAEYCYRVRAYNTHGESFSSMSCFVTKDGRGVWRAQIEFHTADISDAGTDGSVRVKLNDKTFYGTWLDYGGDDRERGDIFTYDLNLTGISDLSDISMIDIEKTGTDAWCVQELSLLVNGVEIYNRDFGSPSSTCRWLDNGDGHWPWYTISRQTLRAHSLWVSHEQPDPPLNIPAEETASRVESMVGHLIHGNALYWGHLSGDRYVEMWRTDSQTVHIDLDLAASVTGPDPEVDIDFDLRFTGSCNTGGQPLEITVTTENINISVDSNWYWEVLSFGVMEYVDYTVEERVQDAFTAITRTMTADAGGYTICLTPQVNADGSVDFRIEFPAPAAGTGASKPQVMTFAPTK